MVPPPYRARILAVLVFVGAALPWGCGYDDRGEGTQTVKLLGRLACAYPALTSQAEFVLARDALPLQNANVTLIDADSHESFNVAETATAGTYAAEWLGYHRRVQVHVLAGKDFMSFQIEGPSQHVIDAPRPGTLVKAKAPLKVRWTSPDGVRADEVEVSVEGDKAAVRLGRDGGKVRFAGREFGAGNQTLQVVRSRHLVPQGASGGSRMTSSYAVSTPFVRLTDG